MVGEIDLSFISSEICCTFGQLQIRYLPCMDETECLCSCNADKTDQMALLQQTVGGIVIDCWYLAMNEDIPNIFEREYHNEKAYVLQYTNGFAERITDFRFFCGDTTLDVDRTACGQVQGTMPQEYYLEIYSSTICSVEPPPVVSPQSNGLSGGWIFIIWYCISILV